MNRPCLQRTTFINSNDEAKSFGFRFYDDVGQTYCNTMEEADLQLPDEEFLDKCKSSFDEVADAIFDLALDNGMYIDDKWYHFDLDHQDGPKLIKPIEDS